MSDTLSIRERLIAIAYAAEMAGSGKSQSATCGFEELLSALADSPDRNGPSLSGRTVRLIFQGDTDAPRSATVDAIKHLLRDNSIKKVLKGKQLRDDWDTLPRSEFLQSLALPEDTQLTLNNNAHKKLRPFHVVVGDAFLSHHRTRIEEKYGGVYSVYRRHARKRKNEIVEEVLWIGFISKAQLPQALFLTEEGLLIGEVVPTEKAWSIQFISLDTNQRDRTENDTLRIERREGRNVHIFPGVRTRSNLNRANVAYRTILVRHSAHTMGSTDPDPEAFEQAYKAFLCDHPDGSPLQTQMMKLLEQDYPDAADADCGVMHMRGTELDLDLDGLDPTTRGGTPPQP